MKILGKCINHKIDEEQAMFFNNSDSNIRGVCKSCGQEVTANPIYSRLWLGKYRRYCYDTAYNGKFNTEDYKAQKRTKEQDRLSKISVNWKVV